MADFVPTLLHLIKELQAFGVTKMAAIVVMVMLAGIMRSSAHGSAPKA